MAQSNEQGTHRMAETLEQMNQVQTAAKTSRTFLMLLRNQGFKKASQEVNKNLKSQKESPLFRRERHQGSGPGRRGVPWRLRRPQPTSVGTGRRPLFPLSTVHSVVHCPASSCPLSSVA